MYKSCFAASARTYEHLKGRSDVTVCVCYGGFEEEPDTGHVLYKSGGNVASNMPRESKCDIPLDCHQQVGV